ncbi:MAG: DUF488 domain-containing protein [Candidatus Limnocylindrales bacterium]
MTIQTRHVYAEPAETDGYRVLVDRLWPRGLSKAAAHVDLWLRDIGPSTGLRKWYGHEPERWAEFHERYERELEQHSDLLDLIQDLERQHRRVTLLFGTREHERNEATVIADVLGDRPAHAHT